MTLVRMSKQILMREIFKNIVEILKKMKQDIFQGMIMIFDYVDIQMKLKRKDARKGKTYLSRPYAIFKIWDNFVNFWHDRFGTEYLNDNDTYTELNNFTLNI